MLKTLYFLIRYYSFTFSSNQELSANTQYEQVKWLWLPTNKKRRCLHLPVRLSWPTTAPEKNRQRNIHVKVYRYTVKCAYEDTCILAAHYGVWYTHPVAITSAMFLFLCSIVVVSKVQKQSAITPFQYVVPHPAALRTSVSIPATMGR